MGVVLPVKVLNKEKDVIFSGTPEEVLKWLRENYRLRDDVTWVQPGIRTRLFSPYAFLHNDLGKKARMVDKGTIKEIENGEPGIVNDVYDWYLKQHFFMELLPLTPEKFLDWWDDLKLKKKIRFLESMPQHKMVNRYEP